MSGNTATAILAGGLFLARAGTAAPPRRGHLPYDAEYNWLSLAAGAIVDPVLSIRLGARLGQPETQAATRPARSALGCTVTGTASAFPAADQDHHRPSGSEARSELVAMCGWDNECLCIQ